MRKQKPKIGRPEAADPQEKRQIVLFTESEDATIRAAVEVYKANTHSKLSGFSTWANKVLLREAKSLLARMEKKKAKETEKEKEDGA